MAKDYSFTMDGHPNIYHYHAARKLNIYFSEPDAGVNENTGMLLLIPGFGGNANSNVYKKMRSQFADKYDLVTVQCDYFGWEFMQRDRLKESPSHFNDMGLMQVLDNITAVAIVAEIIKENKLIFNAGKIVAYGHSHGAYLAYLCNVFAPSLFSLIIDNSAWLFPVYLKDPRVLQRSDGRKVIFEYFAKTNIQDEEILELASVYGQVENQCVIHAFHGADDPMVPIQEKRDFCSALNRCRLHEISRGDVDGQRFKSSSHGLNADFLLLFDHVMNDLALDFPLKNAISIPDHSLETRTFRYFVEYPHHIPILKIESKAPV